MTAIFLSDVHLKDSTSVKTRRMIRFFQQVASRFENIYVLGDLFDVWPGTTDFQIQAFRPVLNTLGALVRDGHRVHYLEGNHDFRLGKYFTQELGVHVYANEIIETWNGRHIYMAHGDLGNPQERGYRVLRALLRQDLLHQVVRQIPSPWVYWVGDKASRLSRRLQKKVPPNEEKIREIYRQTARGQFEKGYDVVIMGHTHLPDHYSTKISGRMCHYYNLGDWVKNFTYLEFDGTEFYNKRHSVKCL